MYFLLYFVKILIYWGVEQISAFQEIMNGFDFSYIISLVLGVIPSLICITVHEMSHGYVAYRLGDDTAKRMGRLTLNPIKHLDLLGLVMMLTVHVGWAKPVPVNMYRFKNPKKGMALTALAGPVSNVLLSILAVFLYGLLFIPLIDSRAGYYALQTLQYTSVISIGLAIFNILPFPPLDGSKVLFSLLSDEGYNKLMRYERYGGIILFVVVLSGALGSFLSNAVNTVYSFIFPIAQVGFDLTSLIIK